MRRSQPGSRCNAPFSPAWPIWEAEIPRLDAELVRRGMVRSRSEAQRLVRQGAVRVADAAIRKPAHPVGEADDLWVDADHVSRYVNRGAEKLAHALTEWRLPVKGRRWCSHMEYSGMSRTVTISSGESS